MNSIGDMISQASLAHFTREPWRWSAVERERFWDLQWLYKFGAALIDQMIEKLTRTDLPRPGSLGPQPAPHSAIERATSDVMAHAAFGELQPSHSLAPHPLQDAAARLAAGRRLLDRIVTTQQHAEAEVARLEKLHSL